MKQTKNIPCKIFVSNGNNTFIALSQTVMGIETNIFFLSGNTAVGGELLKNLAEGMHQPFIFETSYNPVLEVLNNNSSFIDYGASNNLNDDGSLPDSSNLLEVIGGLDDISMQNKTCRIRAMRRQIKN